MFSIGVVVASYPEGNSVDVLLDDGSRLSNVQVLVPSGSVNTGVIDLPDIGGPAGDGRWAPTAKRDRYVKAMVGFMRELPFVAGFLLPQSNQITFAEKNRYIHRHASDVYTSIDDAGNLEVSHPSGTFIRIGATPEHENLTGKDFDGAWAITNNTTSPTHLRIVVANGGVTKATLSIDPSGNVSLTNTGTTSITSDLGVSVTSGGSITLDASNVTCTGALTVEGVVLANGAMNVSGGNIVMARDLDVYLLGSAGLISLRNHVHGGVQPGGGTTLPPS